MKSRTLPALAVLTLLFTSIFGFSSAQGAPRISPPTQLVLQGANGVSIDSSLYLPSKLPAPAILLAHGFGGSKNSVATQAQYLAQNGYVVLAWSARGFGQSTGQITMDSPKNEIADVESLITY